MKGISVSDAAKICGGVLNKHSDAEILGVCIDSRKVSEGFMFAALKGEHSDGHDYIAKEHNSGHYHAIHARETKLGGQPRQEPLQDCGRLCRSA